MGRWWCTCWTHAWQGKPGRSGSPVHGSMANRKAIDNRTTISHVLSQTQALLEMRVLSGDPKHGSLSLQEVIRTMLWWSESLDVQSSTRKLSSSFLCLKYLQSFTWTQWINNLIVHGLWSHRCWHQSHAMCILSSMVEEAGCIQRPLLSMKDGTTARNLFNQLHDVNREAWNLKKPSPLILQISNYCRQALGAHDWSISKACDAWCGCGGWANPEACNADGGWANPEAMQHALLVNLNS